MSHQSGSAHRSNHGYSVAGMGVLDVWIVESKGHLHHATFHRDIQVKHAAASHAPRIQSPADVQK